MISDVIEILTCIIDATIVVWFVSRFNNVNFFTLKAVAFFTVYSLFNVFNLYTVFFSAFSSFINLLFILCFSVSFRSQALIKRIVCPFVFEGTLIVNNTSVIVLISLIADAEFSAIAEDRNIVRIIVIILSKFLLYTVLSIILRFSNRQDNFTYKDVFMLILFPISFFFQLAVMIKIALIYPVSEMYGYFVLAIIAIIISYVGVYYIVYQLIKNNKIESEKNLYQQMLSFEEKRYDDMNESLEQMRKIKHDITHQFCSVKAKLDNQDLDGANKELDKIMCNVNSTGTIIQTENKIVDYIVNTKLGKLNGVTILVSGDITDLKLIDDLDLSIILGNIIDNAVEAVEGMENPKIELSFSRKDYYQNIVCGNSIRSSVLKENPDLLTSKPNKISHGYGIKSVRGIVERYNGQVRFFESENDFFVHIMIPVIPA